jgi:hypothetical protein
MEMLIAPFTISIFTSHSPSDTHNRLVVIYSNDEGVPISFPLGNDGVALVTSLRLSLRFHMSEDFMFIDEEVYDTQSGDLIHTIGQSPVCDGDFKQCLFNAGRYRVYGISNSVMATSTELVTPHRSSTGTVQLIPATRVKVKKMNSTSPYSPMTQTGTRHREHLPINHLWLIAIFRIHLRGFIFQLAFHRPTLVIRSLLVL